MMISIDDIIHTSYQSTSLQLFIRLQHNHGRNPLSRSQPAVQTNRAKALDWDMIREMAGSGLATFGGHTVSHPLLRQLDRASLVAEIGGCRHRLREAAASNLPPSGKIRRSAHRP